MKKSIFSLCLAAAFSLASFSTHAAYPDKPIRFIVTFPAGGMTDLLARTVANELQNRLGQSVVVQNRGGMGGSIGAREGAQMPADGYTLTFANVGAMTLNTVLFKDVGYDPIKDFVPVSAIAAVPNMLVVSSDSPYKKISDIVEYARENPGKMNYASTGTGASPWLGTELLKSMAKIDILEVPYKGAGPALIDTISGRTAFVFNAVAMSMEQIKAGKIRALGVSSAKRVSIAPDVPTIAEQGYPGFDVVAWYGLWAPSGTPSEIVQKINQEVQAILDSKATRDTFHKMGAEIMTGSAQDFADYHRSEFERWTTFMRQSGIKPQ